MTALQSHCLGTLPMAAAEVEALYAANRNTTGALTASKATAIRRLCLSHERLRAELEGAEAILAAVDAAVELARKPVPS